MRSISSANLKDFFPPSDCNSPNEALQYILLVCTEKMLKSDGDKIQLWRTLTVVVLLLHIYALANLLVIEGLHFFLINEFKGIRP